jgi:hypothetical protein
MAQGESSIKYISRIIKETAYWFHDIRVSTTSNDAGTVTKTISPMIQAIMLIIAIIILHRICPDMLRSLVDLFIETCKTIASLSSILPAKTGLTLLKNFN